MQYLYLIKCQQFYKIGIANDVRSRLAQLATGNPYPLDVLAIYRFESANIIEAALHQRFKRFRQRGEWFGLGEKELAIFHKVCQLLGGVTSQLPIVNDFDIEDAEVLAVPTEGAKFDYSAMFADGWRMEVANENGKPRNWYWRRGSGTDRTALYGGTMESLPFPVDEMRKRFGGDS